MRRFLLTLGGLGLAAMTLAGPRLSYAGGGAPVPPEWVGIWTSVDSIYDCTTGALAKVVERTDTLCAGQEIGDDPNAPPHLSTTCSGSADAGHIQVHCGASGLCGEACTFDYTSDLDETRTGDTAFGERTTKSVSSCGSTICEWCLFTRTHSTRVGPGPCGPVPATPATWGKLKAGYR